MKQSYSLTIADMALDITTDASPEELENIVGILDRRIREILLKAAAVPKTRPLCFARSVCARTSLRCRRKTARSRRTPRSTKPKSTR